ncbi:putative RNA-directed DNA polymerase [Tanacetum coccineum]
MFRVGILWFLCGPLGYHNLVRIALMYRMIRLTAKVVRFGILLGSMHTGQHKLDIGLLALGMINTYHALILRKSYFTHHAHLEFVMHDFGKIITHGHDISLYCTKRRKKLRSFCVYDFDGVLGINGGYEVDGNVTMGFRVVNYANLSPKNLCFAFALNKSIKPTCYKDFILETNWIGAMNAKIEALNKSYTWIITDLLANRKTIDCKWMFKKYKANGEIKRYKARLVDKGFNQREGIDFDETFFHVVKMSTVRCLIALFVKNKWPLFQLDVNNTFLYGDLEEDVYMTIPQGFSNKGNKNKGCKLVKFLYGLKQAPRKWNEKLVSILKENGNYVNEIKQFKDFLKSKFNIKDLRSLKDFLEIEVIKTNNDIGEDCDFDSNEDEVVPKVDDVSLVEGVFDGAFGGDGDEDFVIGEGVVVTSSS